MSIKIPRVIGQGAYGCVHKPSLKCKDDNGRSYLNKVSKVLDSEEASSELHQYDKVKNADAAHNYYLGVPDLCNIDNKNIFNLKAIQKCKIGSQILKKLNEDKFKLLIMEDGGINLEEYTNNIKKWNISIENKERCEQFLLESLRIFNGLKVFKRHGLIHHDLKPQNIVYDQIKNRLNFIDFGLMISKDKLIKEAKSSLYDFAMFHWSYPWELEYIDRETFDKTVNSQEEQIKKLKLIHDQIRKRKGIYYEHSKNFFFYSMDTESSLENYQQSCTSYIAGYDRTIKENLHEFGYNKFLEESVNSIDVFGLGIALNY